VLESKAIPYQLLVFDADWALATDRAIAAAARHELSHYAEERLPPRDLPPQITAFSGAASGALVYLAILSSTAYGAGASLFGVDWFAVGAVDATLAARWQWWRAVTALTLHGGPEHLIGNLLFGVVAGTLCSRLWGPGIAWLSILLAGGLANLLEPWLTPLDHRAIGASTAVFAAIGLLAGYSWRQRLSLRERWLYRWTPLIGGVSLLAFLGAGTTQVDVLGHLLGFSVGVALGWVYAFADMPRSRRLRWQLLAGFAAVAIVVSAWGFALRSVNSC
jgi:membrane associated rhomboid family serine protease